MEWIYIFILAVAGIIGQTVLQEYTKSHIIPALKAFIAWVRKQTVTSLLGWGLCILFILAYSFILMEISRQFGFNLLSNLAVFNAAYKFLIIALLCPIIAMVADLIAQKVVQLLN
ncbi:MAG: hypothetical protein AAF693_22065 [Bacteroidota bacterium]